MAFGFVLYVGVRSGGDQVEKESTVAPGNRWRAVNMMKNKCVKMAANPLPFQQGYLPAFKGFPAS